MFRLNLYPEAEEKRRARKARFGATVLTGALSGLLLLLAFFQFVGASLLGERVRALNAQKSDFDARAAAISAKAVAIVLPKLEARLVTRANRVVWGPRLVEIARLLPAPLVIERISAGRTERGQTDPEFFIQGRVAPRAGVDPVSEVVKYLEALNASAVASEGMKGFELSSVREDQNTGETVFRIVSIYSEVTVP